MTTSALLTSLLPPMLLVPGAVCTAAALRRHHRLGPIDNRRRALDAVAAHLYVMVTIAVLTCVAALLALILDAAAWGLAASGGFCLTGCCAGVWIGSTSRWHRPPAVRLHIAGDDTAPRSTINGW